MNINHNAEASALAILLYGLIFWITNIYITVTGNCEPLTSLWLNDGNSPFFMFVFSFLLLVLWVFSIFIANLIIYRKVATLTNIIILFNFAMLGVIGYVLVKLWDTIKLDFWSRKSGFVVENYGWFADPCWLKI